MERYIFEKGGEKQEVRFRPYKTSDFKMYLECVQAFYKDGYPYKEYLQETRLHQKIIEKELFVTVGETEDGKIISIVAAILQTGSFTNSILFMLRNVLPEYSGVGIASKQLDYMIEQLPKQFPNAESVYADVVTYNSISQQSLIHRGYVLCGMRLMLYKNEIMVPNLTYDAGTKLTQTVYCLNLKNGIQKTIYVPEEHKERISSIYQKLGVKAECLDMSDCIQEDNFKKQNHFQFTLMPEHEKAEWMIQEVSNNFVKEITISFEQYEKMEHRTAVVYLNMCDSHCKTAWDYFRRKGFYFSGVKPLNQEYEYIMLSDTKHCNEQFKNIVLCEGEACLLEYILERKE